ncbi:unnamed protein product [Sphagnum balticum]
MTSLSSIDVQLTTMNLQSWFDELPTSCKSLGMVGVQQFKPEAIPALRPMSTNLAIGGWEEFSYTVLEKIGTHPILGTGPELRQRIQDVRKELLTGAAIEQLHYGDEPGLYLCGNQIGLQPRQTSVLLNEYLSIWAAQGMYGLGKKLEDSTLANWGEIDRVAADLMAKVVGGLSYEVSVMGNLTTNLHVLMASFYKPCHGRSKIIIERKAFSSDYVGDQQRCFSSCHLALTNLTGGLSLRKYAIQSQIQWHGLDVAENMVFIDPECDLTLSLSTSTIFSILETYASSAALIVLSGVQYLSGQVLDMEKITSFAHSKGIIVGWDLAHAVGNVELRLHDWDVDFAVWCNYKYMNSGPGAIGSIFVHKKYGKVDPSLGMEGYRPRLVGWWGNDIKNRFEMRNSFAPGSGAAGYQISNPSVLDTVALISSLEIFNLTSMFALRQKSVLLTGYLEYLLGEVPSSQQFEIITSSNPFERGAQLSLRFEESVLNAVMLRLKEKGIVVAQKQDVMRVAPVPMYNSFVEVWEFVAELQRALSACGK